MPAEKAIEYARANQEKVLSGLVELLRIPSISTDSAYKADIERCADWVVGEMTRVGLKYARKFATAGHPVVYGEWLEAGADKPTIVIYAHYDVQPVDPLDLWETPPFEPAIRDGWLYARGACDDKCGVWGVLTALEAMFAANGSLPVNVKLFFEGEEEIASPNMQPFVAANKDLLKGDLFILCDGPFEPDDPVLDYALRGVTAVEVKITGPDHDVHSGSFGGAVHNPLHLAGKIIGSFHDAAGRIQIPGFYEPVQPLSAAEKASLDAIWEPKVAELQARTGAPKFWAESQGSFAVRTTALPTLDVNGVWGGYQGEGVKTIIPSEAGFKVTMRLVPDQNPRDIARLFEEYIHSFATDTLKIATRVQSASWPCTLVYDGPLAEALNRAFLATCGKPIRWTRVGGSIPIGGMFQHELGVPMVGLGLGAGDKFHAPNEYLRLDDFSTAIETLIHYVYNAAEVLTHP